MTTANGFFPGARPIDLGAAARMTEVSDALKASLTGAYA
jgi:hypothetical protein